jgi:hypothetical protein
MLFMKDFLRSVNRNKKILVVLLLASILILAISVVYRSCGDDQQAANALTKQTEFETKELRVKDLPEMVLSSCRDRMGRIADRGEGYNYSDVVVLELPNSRLVRACHFPDDSWYIHCEIGGFAPTEYQFRFEKNGQRWERKNLGGQEPLADCGPEEHP